MNVACLLLALIPDSGSLSTSAPRATEYHDVDLDGRVDVLVHLKSGALAIYRALGDDELVLANDTCGLPPDLRAHDVVWMDVDLDDDVDLVLVDTEGGLRSFSNHEGLLAEDPLALGGLELGAQAQIALVDLEGEGRSTLVVKEQNRTVLFDAGQGGLVVRPDTGAHETARARGGGSFSPQAPSAAAYGASLCADRVADTAGGACLAASSSPTLDHLYPLSQHWMIAPDGEVGLGTLDPDHRLHVKAPWNTQGWGDAVVASEANGDTIGLGIYNSGRKWDLANIVSGGEDYFALRDTTAGKTRLSIDSEGHMGVATIHADHLLHVRAPWNSQGWSDAIVVSQASNDTIGIGIYNDNRKWDLANLVTTSEEIFAIRDSTAGSIRMAIDQDGQVGIGTTSPRSALDVRGRIRTEVLEITAGMDIIEYFDLPGGAPEPGSVVVIDRRGTGNLCVSSEPYDPAVAGIVSGAGGVRPGLALSQEGIETGSTPVAMTGRVFVRASAENGPILPGDRLTTAERFGHAMKATDSERCDGAVIGKAMSDLDEGTGLVLVLVNLQ